MMSLQRRRSSGIDIERAISFVEEHGSDLEKACLKKVREKRDRPALSGLRCERFREGLCMQIMHVGPYSEEPRTIEQMRAFAHENGYMLRGRHHEIYLGDPRRAKPEKLKTALRHPIERAM